MFSECNQKNGPVSFKYFLDIIKQFITLLPALTWQFFIINSCLPTHFSVLVTRFAEHESHLKIWRGYASIQFGFLKWKIFSYFASEGSASPKPSQTHSAVKHLPLCQGENTLHRHIILPAGITRHWRLSVSLLDKSQTLSLSIMKLNITPKRKQF